MSGALRKCLHPHPKIASAVTARDAIPSPMGKKETAQRTEIVTNVEGGTERFVSISAAVLELSRESGRGQNLSPPNGSQVNPRPDGPLDFPPPDGGVVENPPPLLTRHLAVVARNRKMRSTARKK